MNSVTLYSYGPKKVISRMDLACGLLVVDTCFKAMANREKKRGGWK